MTKSVRSFCILVLTLATVLSASAQTRAYVTDLNSDVVLVYNATTYAFIAAVPTGFDTDPERIDVTPNQLFAYVSLNATGQVAVINTSTNTLAATVNVGNSPQGIAVTPDGAFVYVANSGSNSLSVIATGTNTVVATVPLAASPVGLAITPDGASVYVTTTSPSSVMVVDTATNTVTATIPLALSPGHPDITPDGAFVYVPTSMLFAGSATQVISTASNTVVATISGAGGLDLELTPDGLTAYVVGTPGVIHVIDTTTNTLTTNIPDTGTSFGTEIQPPTGAFAWAASGATTVNVFSTATNTLVTSIPTGGFPQDIAFVVGSSSNGGPTNVSQCKKGGWATYTNPSFKNQGQCVSYVNHLKHQN